MGEKSGNGDSSAGEGKGLAEEEEVGGMGREGKHHRVGHAVYLVEGIGGLKRTLLN